jgi:hypothetical protein
MVVYPTILIAIIGRLTQTRSARKARNWRWHMVSAECRGGEKCVQNSLFIRGK